MLNDEDTIVPLGTPEPTPAASVASSAPQQSEVMKEFGFRSTTPRFLLVEVPRGATRADLVKAVDHALSVPQVPFFKNTTPTAPRSDEMLLYQSGATGSGDPQGSATGTSDPTTGTTDPSTGTSSSDGGWPGFGPHDGLLLFVKQEGFP